MYLLEAKNIRKSFGELNVLKNISLSVSESEVVSPFSGFFQCLKLLMAEALLTAVKMQ